MLNSYSFFKQEHVAQDAIDEEIDPILDDFVNLQDKVEQTDQDIIEA